MVSIGLLNELMDVEEALDGKYVTLYPVSDAPMEVVWGNRYTVVVARQPDGKWRATAPRLHRSGGGNTQIEAENDLVRVLKEYLRKRTAFLHDAANLVKRFIEVNLDEAAVNPGEGRKMLPVWQVIGAMPKDGLAYAASDDTPVMDTGRIASTASALDIPIDAVRAAVAYYLEHKQEIWKQLSTDSLDQVNHAFAQLEAESGLNEEDLSSDPESFSYQHER